MPNQSNNVREIEFFRGVTIPFFGIFTVEFDKNANSVCESVLHTLLHEIGLATNRSLCFLCDNFGCRTFYFMGEYLQMWVWIEQGNKAGPGILFALVVPFILAIGGFVIAKGTNDTKLKIGSFIWGLIWTIAILVVCGTSIGGALKDKKNEQTIELSYNNPQNIVIEITDKINLDNGEFLFPLKITNNSLGRIVGADIDLTITNWDNHTLLQAKITRVDCNTNANIEYELTVSSDSEKADELYYTSYQHINIYITINMLDYNDRIENYYFDDHRILKEVDMNALESAYNEAVEAYNNADYNRAIEKFSVLGSYKESSRYLSNSYHAIENATLEEVYLDAKGLYNKEQYSEAYDKFSEVKDYKDSQSLMEVIIDKVENLSLQYANNGDYEAAYNTLIDFGFSANSYDQNYLPILQAYRYAAMGQYQGAVFCGLTKIIVSDGATEIGGFQSCTNLLEVIMPDSVEHVGNYAFSECTSLATLKLSPNIKTIGNYAFSGCTALTTLDLPFGIEYIGMNAFSNCDSLEKIILPISLQSVSLKGWNSFDGEIHYAGTVEQWKQVVKEHAFMTTLNKTIYCSNGNVEP